MICYRYKYKIHSAVRIVAEIRVRLALSTYTNTPDSDTFIMINKTFAGVLSLRAVSPTCGRLLQPFPGLLRVTTRFTAR